MDFRKLASMAGKAIGDEVNKKANEMEKATRRDLSRRTDSEIRRASENRYDNPNIKGWQRRLLEEEAERRNID